MGELAKWRAEKWVRIGTDGSIKGACGTSKNKKNPDRCLPLKKANSLSKSERARTARKKKAQGKKRQFVSNTKRARVTKKYTKR
jgi:hypothetical protein